MLFKSVLLIVVITVVNGHSLGHFLTGIGSSSNDANTCLSALFTGPCSRDIKTDQQEQYYCCVLWDELDCFKANYKDVCTPEDAAALEKVWADIQLTISGTVYSENSCTADSYGVDMSRDVCKV